MYDLRAEIAPDTSPLNREDAILRVRLLPSAVVRFNIRGISPLTIPDLTSRFGKWSV